MNNSKVKMFPKNIYIKGLGIVADKVGIKSVHKEDVAIIVFKNISEFATMLTQSRTCAANIKWLKKIKRFGRAKILFVNSGNANAYTGKEGDANLKKIIKLLASRYSCQEKQIIISSTGVIGEQLPINKILNYIKTHFIAEKKQDWDLFARSIRTTDTFNKGSYKECYIGKKKIKLIGIAKGSGMIFPNMATMLGFIFTDADLNKAILNQLLKKAVEKSFNRITVDGDMSTNDMICFFSTRAIDCGSFKSAEDKKLKEFLQCLQELSLDLAKKIVIDGEGAKKLIEINVKGAVSDIDAKNIAFAVANSALVKTAIAGEDANWGRIIMAIGKTSAKIDQELISLSIGNIPIISFGEIIKDFNEKRITKHLKKNQIFINIDLLLGSGESKVWTCDLTKEYISINADYRS